MENPWSKIPLDDYEVFAAADSEQIDGRTDNDLASI